MADNIEMKGVHTETKPAPEGQANLLDLPGMVADGGEPDMEKGQPAATANAGAGVDEQRNQHDVSPLTVPTGAAESTDAAGTTGGSVKQDERLVPKLRSFATNKACIASTLVVVALLAATIALAVIVSKDTNKIHSLEHNSKRFDTYLGGFSGVFDHHPDLHSLAKHNVNINLTTSSTDTCGDADDNNDSTTFTVVHPVTADATTTFVFTTFIVNKTMTVTANTTTLFSVPTNTTAMVSFATTESCLEWGDGAGPCTRPYGSPNSTPESVLSGMSSVAALSATPTTVSADGTTALVVSMSLPATVATPSSGSIIGGSDTETVDALSIAASTSSSDCAAPAITTVFVTITTNPGDETTTTGGSTTMTMVDTETNHVTSTIQGSSSLVTMTETLPWGNNTTSTVAVVTALNGSLTTLSVPNFTITLQSTVGSNGTAAITTTAKTDTGTSATTGTSGASTTTAVVASGGEKAVGKPFLGGHTNNNGGHTDNGLYYVVMLVGIVTALFL